MSEKNDTSQHSGSTSGSKNVTNHTIIQQRKSELFDPRIIPQLCCVRKLLFHETEKFIFTILKFLTPSNIASMIIAGQRKMTPANILVQPPGPKTAQIIQYSNQESQNSLTRGIIPQLRCVRKLLFHETANFIFTILTLQLTISLIILYEH